MQWLYSWGWIYNCFAADPVRW